MTATPDADATGAGLFLGSQHMTFALPTPHRFLTIPMDDGTIIHVRQHGDPTRPVRIFLSHGNGFATDGYFPFWQLLLDRFELIVFDFRNHGWNACSAMARHHYDQLVLDLDTLYQAVTTHLGPKTSVGAFHSLSARTAIKHAMDVGWRWDALALFDPPNVPPRSHPLYDRMERFDHRLASWARSRPQRFADPSEQAEVFRNIRVHRNWVEGAYDLMARSILHREEASGEWVLTCPGAYEANIYLSNLTLNIWPSARDFGGPVKLIAADPTVERPGLPALTNRELAEHNGFDYTCIPGAGHMLQIEQPDMACQAFLTFLAEVGIIASAA